MSVTDISSLLEEFRVIGASNRGCLNRQRSTASCDLYAEHMQAALREINRPDYPAGMIPWLGENAPGLYAILTEDLPNEIDQLWNARAPIVQFEETLRRLVKLHGRCCEFYCQHIAGQPQTNPTAAHKTSKGDFRTSTGNGATK